MAPIDHQFFAELGRTPRLTHEENVALGRRIRAGDRAAIRLLVAGNLRLIPRFAARRLRPGAEIGDLIAEGVVGLTRAAESYDPDRAKFSTYACTWIKSSIGRSLPSYTHRIKLPEHLSWLDAKNRRTRERYAGHIEVAGRCRFASGGGEALAGICADRKSPPGGSRPDFLELERLDRALGGLSDRDRTVVSLYFGLGGGVPLILEQIAPLIGCSRANVGRIVRVSLDRLRKALAPTDADTENPGSQASA